MQNVHLLADLYIVNISIWLLKISSNCKQFYKIPPNTNHEKLRATIVSCERVLSEGSNSKLDIKFKEFSRTFKYQINFLPGPFYYIDFDTA